MPKPKYENIEICDVCGKDIAECTCPICPICGCQGDPACYSKHKCGGLVGYTPPGTKPPGKGQK